MPSHPSDDASPLAGWKAACESNDADAAIAFLASDAELISPLTGQYRFQGRDQVGDVLIEALDIISDIRFHTDVGDDRTRAVFFHARVGAQAIEEAQLHRLDEHGKIRELTLFGRPLPGLTAVMAHIGPRLLRRQGRGRLAPFIAAGAAPLAAVTRVMDKRVVPITRPRTHA